MRVPRLLQEPLDGMYVPFVRPFAYTKFGTKSSIPHTINQLEHQPRAHSNSSPKHVDNKIFPLENRTLPRQTQKQKSRSPSSRQFGALKETTVVEAPVQTEKSRRDPKEISSGKGEGGGLGNVK